MASIINASSTGSGGIVQTADASGVLQLQSNGTTALTVSGANVTIAGTLSTGNSNPQVTQYLSGSGTYTTPTGAKYITVRMVGGGGGGGGSGGAGTPGTGGTGGTTTFGSSLLTATGGIGGAYGLSAPVGGSATVNSPATAIVAVAGGSSGSGYTNVGNFVGGNAGGSSPFGGAGGGGNNLPGVAAVPNTGSGGGSAGVNGGSTSAGGASGGYIEALISSPSASYSYAVGAAGTAGAAGTGAAGNFAGAAGGSGVIIVTAYF
jgi:hypothetical protein